MEPLPSSGPAGGPVADPQRPHPEGRYGLYLDELRKKSEADLAKEAASLTADWLRSWGRQRTDCDHYRRCCLQVCRERRLMHLFDEASRQAFARERPPASVEPGKESS